MNGSGADKLAAARSLGAMEADIRVLKKRIDQVVERQDGHHGTILRLRGGLTVIAVLVTIFGVWLVDQLLSLDDLVEYQATILSRSDGPPAAAP